MLRLKTEHTPTSNMAQDVENSYSLFATTREAASRVEDPQNIGTVKENGLKVCCKESNQGRRTVFSPTHPVDR